MLLWPRSKRLFKKGTQKASHVAVLVSSGSLEGNAGRGRGEGSWLVACVGGCVARVRVRRQSAGAGCVAWRVWRPGWLVWRGVGVGSWAMRGRAGKGRGGGRVVGAVGCVEGRGYVGEEEWEDAGSEHGGEMGSGPGGGRGEQEAEEAFKDAGSRKRRKMGKGEDGFVEGHGAWRVFGCCIRGRGGGCREWGEAGSLGWRCCSWRLRCF